MASPLLILLFLAIATGQLQDGCDRSDSSYVDCDHKKDVCECTSDECFFCFEIEHRHTFTRYLLSESDVQIPGFGGEVWYFNKITGQFQKQDQSETRIRCPVGDITNCTEAITVDGNSFRSVIAINNRFPGPTLIVPENAIVVVDVYNRLDAESTSIHWHGMHQMNVSWMDGVEHITQCGIPPSSSFRYIFRARPAGTHWYHSHSGAQRTDGFFGALIVRETDVPTEYAVLDTPDKHTLTLIDWQLENSLDLFTQLHGGIRLFDQRGVPPDGEVMAPPRTCSSDGTEVGPINFWSALINGRGKHKNISYQQTNLSTFVVNSNSRYRFRLIGAQGLFALRFSIDEHQLTLIATDGNFVKPKVVDFIIIHSGERFDFILETKNESSKRNYIIRAETLETDVSATSDCDNGAKSEDLLEMGVISNMAEAILHYGNENGIPNNTMYQEIADGAQPKYIECAESRNCTAVNCPFQNFPAQYGISCIHIHDLELHSIHYDKALPMYNSGNTLFFNFGFEGDGSTSSLNGLNFRFPNEPLQLATSPDDISTLCTLAGRDNCDQQNKIVSPDCLCTYVREIKSDESYRFVFSATGPNRSASSMSNWNFAHPVHLHGHSFYVTEIGFGNYSSTERVVNATEKIDCTGQYICTDPKWAPGMDPDIGKSGRINRNAPLKDTVLIPAGGYAIVYFISNNPGYWFLHCHIEVHQLEGMSVVINEGKENHNPPPENIGDCGSFKWTIEMFKEREAFMQPVPTEEPKSEEYNRLYTNYIISAAFASSFGLLFAILLIILSVIMCCLCYNSRKQK